MVAPGIRADQSILVTRMVLVCTPRRRAETPALPGASEDSELEKGLVARQAFRGSCRNPLPTREADEDVMSCLLDHSNRRRRVMHGVIEVGTKTDACI